MGSMEHMNTENEMFIRCRSDVCRFGLEFFIVGRENDLGRRRVAKSIVYEEAEICSVITPVLTCDNKSSAAQVLMDDLWNAGVRPTEGAGSAGAMAAVVRHLNDMRSITEKLLGHKLP